MIDSILPNIFQDNQRGVESNTPPPSGPYGTEKCVVMRGLTYGGGALYAVFNAKIKRLSIYIIYLDLLKHKTSISIYLDLLKHVWGQGEAGIASLPQEIYKKKKYEKKIQELGLRILHAEY